jgi:branched-chain amino acid transport system permease protein
MNLQIAFLLGQDGITSGAIYALLALCMVLVFTVTRVLLVPQGEFVTFGAMTMAALQAGQPVVLALLLLGLALLRALVRAWGVLRRRPDAEPLGWADAAYVLHALVMLAIPRLVPGEGWPVALQLLYTLALIAPMGSLLYDLCFKPIAEAHSLVLLISAIALHVALVGLSLWMFGAEGARTQPLLDEVWEFGGVRVNGQALCVVAATGVLMVLLYAYFERSLSGKALRATAIHRFGAQLMGISPTGAGRTTFAIAALIGALSGALIAPVTTLYYDSGFIISRKGFVGAVVGGLVSYPAGALGALAVGLIESYSTFWASAYKEVIVFTLILPILLWRSLAAGHHEEDRA